jgi:formate hydrogenlyase subunit 4
MAPLFESAALQLLHALLVVAVAPALTGIVRLVKSRLTGKRGAPIWQPYRDLWRLLRKEAVVAETASWLFRVAPYMTFAAIWLGAALIPAFSTDLLLGPSVDLIVLVALLGGARFFTALAGLDVGTSFGGIGSSRELMIASLAEPAMLMVIFTVSLLVGTTSLAIIAAKLLGTSVGLRVSLGLGLVAIVMVAIAENARVPVDNPATHLELTMVHEAMILEYSGRHLALMEAAAMLKLLLYLSLIACIFAPWGVATAGQGFTAYAIGLASYALKLAVGGALLGIFETVTAKMRVFRVSDFLGAALMLGLLAALLLFVSRSA